MKFLGIFLVCLLIGLASAADKKKPDAAASAKDKAPAVPNPVAAAQKAVSPPAAHPPAADAPAADSAAADAPAAPPAHHKVRK